MKLSKITIENYRGYYGKNTIEFNVNEKNKHIDLIIARNDTGKTTLLNAIYWCLYGEEQFYSSKNSNKRIISNKKIMDTPIDEKLNFSVSLVFNDEQGPKFEISRKRIFRRARDEDNDLKIIPEGEDDFFGIERNSNGTGFENIEHIENFVASTIPKGISSFFLLDGEQLKAIFTSDINYKIKDAIERVANINSINGMIDNLQHLDKRYSGMKSGIDPNFGVIQSELDKCQDRIDENEKGLGENIKEKEILKKQQSELADYLQNHNEAVIREYGLREAQLRESITRADDERKDLEGELNNLVIHTYILQNTKKALKETSEKFNEIIKGGNFPPAIDPSHILQIIKRGECICGTKLKKGSDEEKNLQKLSSTKSYKEYIRIISQGDAQFPKMINSLNDSIESIAELKKKLSETESIIKKNKSGIEEINQKLQSTNVEEIREKGEEKEMIERGIYKTERAITRIEIDLVDLNNTKKRGERELNDIKTKTLKDGLIIKKSEKCKQMINYAKSIKETIMKSIKNKIEESTAKNFIDLHWKAEDYEKVSILDDFSLSIRDKYRGELINELSQGAALCFGLAFMTALRNYSGYDVPVIIDSPVGKIDEGNREKIAKSLPDQLKNKQVIFLVTSSEHTSVFKKFLKEKISTKINLTYNKKTGGVDIE